MKFVRTKEFKVDVLENQKRQLSSEDKIKKVIHWDNVIAFDIIENAKSIGFVMLQEFEKSKFFLWDFAISHKFQNQGLGTKALIELIGFLKDKYGCTLLTTTYKFGNEQARRVYEKIGFKETDIVDEKDIHEVNMRLEL